MEMEEKWTAKDLLEKEARALLKERREERARERNASSLKSQVDVNLDSAVHFGTRLSAEKAEDALYAAPLNIERLVAQDQGHKEPRKVVREVLERAPEKKM